MNYLIGVLVVPLVFALGGCSLRVHEEHENHLWFKDADDAVARANRLNERLAEVAKAKADKRSYRPLTKAEVFAILGTESENGKMRPLSESTPNFYRMQEEELRSVLFGGFEFRTLEHAREVQQFVSQFEGWRLPYTKTRSDLSLSLPLNKKTCVRGVKLLFVLVFRKEPENGNGNTAELHHSRLSGTALIDRCTSEILVNPFNALRYGKHY